MNRRGSYSQSCDLTQPPGRRNKLGPGEEISDFVDWKIDDIDKEIEKKIEE